MGKVSFPPSSLAALEPPSRTSCAYCTSWKTTECSAATANSFSRSEWFGTNTIERSARQAALSLSNTRVFRSVRTVGRIPSMYPLHLHLLLHLHLHLLLEKQKPLV